MFIVIEFFVKDQSELDSPELDSPLPSSSELEGEPEESELDDDSPLGANTSERIPCFLCSIVCLLPFLPAPSVLKPKIEHCGNNVVAFCAEAQLDRVTKERNPPPPPITPHSVVPGAPPPPLSVIFKDRAVQRNGAAKRVGHNFRILCNQLLLPHLHQRGLCPFLFCWRLLSSIVCFRDTLCPEPNQSRGDIIFIVWESLHCQDHEVHQKGHHPHHHYCHQARRGADLNQYP